MTIETVTYISDLNASYPGAGDNPSEGDDHIRNIKTGIKATFPNITGPVTAVQGDLNQLTSKSVGLFLLATASASNSATIDFTSGIDATYDEYELHVIEAVPASAAIPWMRTSSDAGSTWPSSSGAYGWTVSDSLATSNTVSNGSTTATNIQLDSINTTNAASGGGFSGVIRLINPAGTSAYKRLNWNGSNANSAGPTNISVVSGTAIVMSTSALNGLRFMFSTGNIASGKFKLFGVRKS